MGHYVMPRAFTTKAMEAAMKAAEVVSPGKGHSWLRLAVCDSMSGSKPYAIAVRSLKDGRVQFGCECKHWRFRLQGTGMLCKHQQAVLCGGLTPLTESGTVNLAWYDAGAAFLKALSQAVMDERVSRHVSTVRKAA